MWDKRQEPLHSEGPREREDRGLRIKSQFFRADIVQNKIRSLFSEPHANEAMKLLEILPDFWGLERIQLAVLKLGGNDIEKLRQFFQLALKDYIGVITLAEYPRGKSMGFAYLRLPNHEQAKVHEEDLQEYLSWVKDFTENT